MSASISHEADAGRAFGPITAFTSTHHKPTPPVAHDCVKLIFVRAGSAVLFSEFGRRPVALGDVVALAGNTLCGGEPEGHVTVTTVYLDPDYMIDQVFWQHAAVLSDRLHAQQLAETIYTESAQVMHLGEQRAGMLMPWLDELVALSVDGQTVQRFYRTQALLFAVLDVLIPFVTTTPTRVTAGQRGRTLPSGPRLLHVLQDILGHASVDTTRGYLHPDDRHLASAAEQANAFLARSAKTGGRARPPRSL